MTYGYSKDRRPDLKQVVLEMIVSQDHGIPFLSKVWDGNTSDDEIFQHRTKALVEAFKNAETKKFLIADSKLYSEKNAFHLKDISFITRVNAPLKAKKNAFL